MAKSSERTSFTKDIQGRYLCNDLTEVNAWKNSGGRPFDVIVIGGGTFGSAIAEHIWFRQKQTGGGLRTLVLEAGLFTVPEHVQNTGIQGFADPAVPFTLNENAPQPEPPRNEVWGVPWKSATPFKGLAYAIGHWTRFDFRGGWILAALLIALGLAGIFSASRRAGRKTEIPVDAVDGEAADDASPMVDIT